MYLFPHAFNYNQTVKLCQVFLSLLTTKILSGLYITLIKYTLCCNVCQVFCEKSVKSIILLILRLIQQVCTFLSSKLIADLPPVFVETNAHKVFQMLCVRKSMLNWHELYPSQSFRLKYGSRKMSGFQVISSILFMTKMSEYVFV